MEARYTRLFDEQDKPAFENLEISLIPGFAVPPADPLHTAPFPVSEGATFWVGALPDWNGGAPHPAPRRMIFVTVRGEYEVTTVNGITRSFPVGSVLLVEDTTGGGHSSRILGESDRVIFAVGLPAA